jgi:hypothetical protein
VVTKPKIRGVLRGLPPFPVAVLGACAAILITVALFENPVAGLVEAVLLVLGLWGSYVLGQTSASGGDVRPRVRGSYRRMATLYVQLYDLTQLIASERDGLRRAEEGVRDRAVASLTFIGFAVGQNLSVVSDAMEDWADVVPEEVTDLRQRADQARLEVPEYDDLDDQDIAAADDEGAELLDVPDEESEGK